MAAVRASPLARFSASALLAIGCTALKRAEPLATATSHSPEARPSSRSALEAEPRLRANATPAPAAAPSAELETTTFGTPDPVTFLAAGRTGSWVAYCQARADSNGDGKIEVEVGADGALAGDALAAYVFVQALGELAIEEVFDADDSGRWLAVRRNGRLTLIDVELKRVREIEGELDLRTDALPYAPHRTVRFDALGAALLYVRGERQPVAAIEDLLGERVREIALGDTLLWRAAFSLDTRWIVLRTIPEDTNGNGRRGWPVPLRPKADAPCPGPIPRFRSYIDRGDRPQTELLALQGGVRQSVPGFVSVFGAGHLSRGVDGRLRFVRGSGQAAVFLTPPKCIARVAHVDPRRELVVYGCVEDDPAKRPALALGGVGFQKALGIDIAALAEDRVPERLDRLVAFYPGREVVLLDLDKRELSRLEPGDAVLGTEEGLALVRRNDRLFVFDADTGNLGALAGEVDPLGDVVVNGDVAAVSPLIVKWRERAVVGTSSGRPLALTPDGDVLLAKGRQASGSELALGPLAWERPASLER